MKNILIIRDIPLKTELEIGFSCFINCILLFIAKILPTMYIMLVYMRVCLYPQDCILIWIYRMWLNYITLHYIDPETLQFDEGMWLGGL